MRESNLKTDEANPSPFKQPFLELCLFGETVKKDSPFGSVWFIDVDGKIEKYITKDNKPTDLLLDLCRSIAKAGMVVKGFDRYKGSGGPSMLLRNGALFHRAGSIEDPEPTVLAYEYREPEYRKK